ncbi:MAG TPA: MFS transporter, partial [Thermomicrobiales bacterium]|nr:MFS transporter [Thermomicrobiales bacterium]
RQRNGHSVGSFFRGIQSYSRDIKLFLLYSLIANVGIGVFMLIFNLYLIQLDLAEDFIGRFNAFSTLAMGGVALSIGFLVNRFGVWLTVTVGLVLFIITSVLACVITNPPLLLLMGALSGAGTAFLFVPTMPFIVELTTPRERHSVAALAFSLNSLSMTIGSLVGGFLPRSLASLLAIDTPSAEAYRYTLIVGVGLAGLGIIPLLGMSAQQRHARPMDEDVAIAGGPAPAPPRTVRRHMAVFIAIGGLMSLGAGALFPFYNVFLQRQGASTREIGVIFSAAGLIAAGFGLTSPYLARRLGSLKAVTVVRLTPVPFYFLLLFTPALPIAVIAHIVRTTSINMAWPIDSTYISEVLPSRARAQVFSFRSGAWNFGWALSSVIAGALIVRYGYSVSFVAYIVFITASMLLYYFYFERTIGERRATPVAATTDASELSVQ